MHTIQESIFADPRPYAATQALHQWIIRTMQSCLRGKIIEVAAREGCMTDCLANSGATFRISDPDGKYVELLQDRFAGNPAIKEIHHIDLQHPSFNGMYANFLGRFDTVVALNNLPGLWRNGDMLSNAARLLRPGGYIIMLSPVTTGLFGRSDNEVTTWYNQNYTDFRRLLTKEFEIRKMKYFQSIGPGLPYSAPTPPKVPIQLLPLTLYDQQVCTFPVADRAIVDRLGFSAITIAKKLHPELQ